MSLLSCKRCRRSHHGCHCFCCSVLYSQQRGDQWSSEVIQMIESFAFDYAVQEGRTERNRRVSSAIRCVLSQLALIRAVRCGAHSA